MKKHPPIIQQFIEHQSMYPDAIVATEVGDFFEIWQVGEIGHAIRASQLLDVALTRRNKSDPNSPHMIGFPSRSAPKHFQRLISLGETVVVVEQDVRGSKSDQNKNVSRKITKIISSGTVVENLDESKNNFFASIFVEDGIAGVSLVDLSTGEVKITEIPQEEIEDFILKLNLKEVLISNMEIKIERVLIHVNKTKQTIKDLASCSQILGSLYEITNPTSNPNYAILTLNLEFWRQGVLAFGNLVNYLSKNEYGQNLLKKLAKPDTYSLNKYLALPFNGMKSLEVLENFLGEGNSLFSCLNQCRTAMGRRKLNLWISTPSADYDVINERHEKVQNYLDNNYFCDELKDCYDISRITRKMLVYNLMVHEIAQLYQSLAIAESVLSDEHIAHSKNIKEIKEFILKNIDLSKAESYTDSSMFDFFKGNLLKSVDKYFIEYKEAIVGMDLVKESLEKELSLKNLKIIKKSDGYDLSSVKSSVDKLKKMNIEYEEMASSVKILANTWKIAAKKCFLAEVSLIKKCEETWRSFQDAFISKYGKSILDISEIIGEIDVLSSFAKLAKERGYSRPNIVNKDHAYFSFKDLRHPIVENSKKLREGFVPNDVELNKEKNTLVIYGANSSGKSTILKSVALNIIMAQIGSFIAAGKDSSLTIFESILTRMTSVDSLSEGLSTFTMEMTELQIALQYADKKSLFLFDEIGRGTSVEDGESLAFATLSYLDNSKNKCVTLFATHYHSLYDNIKSLNKLKIQNIECYTNSKGLLVFSRKLKDGLGSGSYGIEVAKSCGLPSELIRIAERYSSELGEIKKSRYNSLVSGSICPICEKNPVQETHHIIEQKQGTVKNIYINGVLKNINHQSNLIMLCSSCHDKITKKQISIELKKILGTTDSISIEIKNE